MPIPCPPVVLIITLGGRARPFASQRSRRGQDQEPCLPRVRRMCRFPIYKSSAITYSLPHSLLHHLSLSIKETCITRQSMASSSSPRLFLLLSLASLLLVLSIPSTISAACTSQTFSNNRNYALCADLPTLNTSLHWTYTAANSSLSIAFVATPAANGGWVSWGINPSAKTMIGSQALLAYRNSNGSVVVDTYNISSYENIVPSPIAYDVRHKEAEYSAGVIIIFATLSLPSGTGTTVNHVWQVGPGMTGTSPKVHAMLPANKQATGSLDFTKAVGGGDGTTGGNGNNTSSGSSPSAGHVAARFSSPFLIASAALLGLLVAAAT